MVYDSIRLGSNLRTSLAPGGLLLTRGIGAKLGLHFVIQGSEHTWPNPLDLKSSLSPFASKFLSLHTYL